MIRALSADETAAVPCLCRQSGGVGCVRGGACHRVIMYLDGPGPRVAALADLIRLPPQNQKRTSRALLWRRTGVSQATASPWSR